MAKLTLKIWIWIICLIIAAIAISPNLKSGVVISTIQENSSLYNAGISTGEIIQQINDVKINNFGYANPVDTSTGRYGNITPPPDR